MSLLNIRQGIILILPEISDDLAGFFVDIQIFDGSSAPSVIYKKSSIPAGSVGDSRGNGECGQDDSVEQTENLMLKLKFLPYKVPSIYFCSFVQVSKFINVVITIWIIQSFYLMTWF